MAKKKGKQADPQKTSSDSEPIQTVLHFRRYIYDPKKKIIQQ
jgi:hypothetical protein